GVLGLIDKPAHAEPSEFFAQERIDQPTIAGENFGPIELGETIGLALRFGRIVELGEGVVLEHEAHAQTNQLLGEPIVAVDVDLERERRPGLQADVNEAKLRIEEVIVEDVLLPWLGDETRPIFAGDEGKGVAGFLSAEDADEPAFDALIAHEPLRPLVLLEGALAIEISALVFTRPTLGMFHEPFGPLRRQNL